MKSSNIKVQIKYKLQNFENKTLLKGAISLKVNSEKTDNNHACEERNIGDTIGDQITVPDKTKVNNKVAPAKVIETICVNQLEQNKTVLNVLRVI